MVFLVPSNLVYHIFISVISSGLVYYVDSQYGGLSKRKLTMCGMIQTFSSLEVWTLGNIKRTMALNYRSLPGKKKKYGAPGQVALVRLVFQWFCLIGSTHQGLISLITCVPVNN